MILIDINLRQLSIYQKYLVFFFRGVETRIPNHHRESTNFRLQWCVKDFNSCPLVLLKTNEIIVKSRWLFMIMSDWENF